MNKFLYIRTTLSVPGAGSATHVAELEELSEDTCRLIRVVSLAPKDVVEGAATPHIANGNIDIPQEIVAHPSTFDQFPDITATAVPAEEFEALWAEAALKFPLN